MRKFEVEVRVDVTVSKTVTVYASSPHDAADKACADPGLAGWVNEEDSDPTTPLIQLCPESLQGAYVDLKLNPEAVLCLDTVSP